ncbi:hypothetical protein NDU88_003551 [Pleurodeles waltl]|uniref:Uncharacterized protein n=1 Tax=Pleurodeles waltl TaxID=8319 RepID=A0AAV7KXA3_PLEWA|nr:hypothetical protein NDU88_003551 [Pleurodeles waltl]
MAGVTGVRSRDASDWRCPYGVQEDEDGVPRSLGNDEADTFPENPDIRVPSDTKREDGLHTSVEEKDAEEPGSAESSKPKKADYDRRTGNHGVPKEAADPGRKGTTGDTLTDRHAPGGTWLTKNIFAGQEGSWKKRKERHFMGQKTPHLHC